MAAAIVYKFTPECPCCSRFADGHIRAAAVIDWVECATLQVMKSGFWIISIFALMLACGGCSRTTTGLSMTKERTAFLRNGVTTRTEVVETLGPPLFDLQSERTVAYYWENEGLSWGYRYPLLGKPKTEAEKATGVGYHEIYKKADPCWLFCIRFDDSNRVIRYGKARQLQTESWSEAIVNWLHQNTD
jgi:hypothetical protein